MDSFKKTSLLNAILNIENLNDSTITFYFRVIGTLLKRVGGDNFKDYLPAIIDVLESEFKENIIIQSTARTYKSALLYAIADASQRLMDSNESIDHYAEFYHRVSSLKSSLLPKKSLNTSSLRYKQFPTELISALENLVAENNKSFRLREAFVFIKANNEIGLRPIEWLEMNFFNYLDKNYIDEYTNGKSGNSILSINVKKRQKQ